MLVTANTTFNISTLTDMILSVDTRYKTYQSIVNCNANNEGI